MAEDARAEARVGTVLDGKWRLERLLGTGGMAAVYEARHRNGARAAVKMLHPELAKMPELRERFLREGYAANRVEHPGAVKVLDDHVIVGGPDDGVAYIVMELLEGEVLDERVARGPIGEQELLAIAASLLDVLASAHAHGVIHRDLKPDNLFLLRTEDGAPRVKVLDFGLARVIETRMTTRAGVTLGTPAYMSPEQAGGRADEIDARSDLFSVGAVLFRLRTGKRIHEADSALELVGKMARLPAPPIREVDPTVSEPFAAIVDRALQFERDARYPDAQVMRADVLAALEKLRPPPRRSGLGLVGWVVVLLVAGAGAVAVRAGRLPVVVSAPSTPVSASAPPEDAAAEAELVIAVDASLEAALEDSAVDAYADDADATDEDEEDDEEDASADAELDAPEPDAPLEDVTPEVLPKVAVADAHPLPAKPVVKKLGPPKPTPKPLAPKPKKKKKKSPKKK